MEFFNVSFVKFAKFFSTFLQTNNFLFLILLLKVKACLKRINHKTNCLILRTTTRFESECTGYFTGKCRVNFPLLRDMEKKGKPSK